ncbi:MAG TPA: sigma-70 family RNA polymerase sigma factor [Tepidisphaeraceae bacterium]|nr:sigma-70 family RNA polymerase sigma factor [Tepidisphaeraceae bacterium]
MKIGPEEFDRLSLEHMDMLFRLARRWTGDPMRAEDLVQETYLRALKARDEFKLEQYGIRPWLVRIMHNVHVTRSQREQRQPMSVDDAHLDLTSQKQAPLTRDPVSFEGMDQRLVKAIEELPSEYQTVLLLWAVDDFSYKEISDALEVPVGTVMSRLHRARSKLLERLGDFARKEGIIRE